MSCCIGLQPSVVPEILPSAPSTCARLLPVIKVMLRSAFWSFWSCYTVTTDMRSWHTWGLLHPRLVRRSLGGATRGPYTNVPSTTHHDATAVLEVWRELNYQSTSTNRLSAAAFPLPNILRSILRRSPLSVVSAAHRHHGLFSTINIRKAFEIMPVFEMRWNIRWGYWFQNKLEGISAVNDDCATTWKVHQKQPALTYHLLILCFISCSSHQPSLLWDLESFGLADIVLLRLELQNKMCVACVVYLVFLTSGGTFTDITSC